MYSQRRSNQGGSVAVFAIITIVLAAAVIGGVFVAQKRGFSARSSQPVMVMPAVEQPKPEAALDEQQKQADADKKAAEQKQASELAQKQAADKKSAENEQKLAANAQKQALDKAADDAKKKAAEAQTPAAVPQTGTAPALPVTGPSDVFAQLIGGGVLVAIILAYLKSYKFRFGSYLK